uniref:SNRNP25 ubiquitin-like domain-containing protein n=1 Tax=Athene cunicularia TaxID=194338 RepID=A0A663N477_ATHCN
MVTFNKFIHIYSIESCSSSAGLGLPEERCLGPCPQPPGCPGVAALWRGNAASWRICIPSPKSAVWGLCGRVPWLVRVSHRSNSHRSKCYIWRTYHLTYAGEKLADDRKKLRE